MSCGLNACVVAQQIPSVRVCHKRGLRQRQWAPIGATLLKLLDSAASLSFTSFDRLSPALAPHKALSFWQGASAQVRERVEAAAAGVGPRGLGPLVVFPEASARISVTSSTAATVRR